MYRLDGSHVLGVEAWYPYDLSNRNVFLITYVAQVIGGSTAVALHISFDSLFVAFVLRLCVQLKIFKHRMKNFNKRSDRKEEFNSEFKFMDPAESRRNLALFTEKHYKILQ